MSGTVTGTQPGDDVKVWFTGGGQTSDSFTYHAEKESDNRVLVLSAEDYTGASPVQATGPNYVSYYQDALAANGIGSDVYDVDAHGRTAATKLGVLSHYDAVVWYTGDDVITREPGWGPGTASRLAMDEMLQAREYLNEDGRILYTGKYAGHEFAGGHGAPALRPDRGQRAVQRPGRARTAVSGCMVRRAATASTTRWSTGSAPARSTRAPGRTTTATCSMSSASTRH